jgi:hypothetical protein
MDAKQYKGFWWLFGNKEEDIPGILEIIEGVSFKLTVSQLFISLQFLIINT